MNGALKGYAERMRSLMEEDIRIAADLRELAKEMRAEGLSAATLKALVKALILDDEGDSGPLEALKARVQDMALYAEALGVRIDGFGETKRFVSQPLEVLPDPPAVAGAAAIEGVPPAAARPVEPGPANERAATGRAAGRADGDLDLPAFLRRGDPACVVPVPAAERGG